MEWSIQQIARLTGTTSRTLRHYDDIALLPPSRIGANGYRYYDERALTRLQRILLLRELGLGLPTIAEVLAGQTDDAAALRVHAAVLREERERLERRIRSVETTLVTMERKEPLMAEAMFDGFDHTRYEEEVVERWGAEAYAASDRWYRSLDEQGRAALAAEQQALQEGFAAALARGDAPDEGPVQQLAARQYAMVRTGWGGTAPSREAFTGLGEMYVADERFARHYGGVEGAAFVRDAMRVWAEANLAD
ncbi:MerR family transcriptional regulator [Microcella daejeonensis]|uniref:MerR family transcriptional regulator n=1 Tax=Microcella daejeonensis TaxID=2994971 RepID=UPI0022710A1D|nr:MerR family transcriptional regulator [Microcella daejeonensis]WAB84330.1 MerR family transcriptional regulator [Microcella daejeonensis]